MSNNNNKNYLEIPQDDGASISKETFGLGIRHLQMLCMMICMIALFIARSSMAVAVLAMTDTKRENDTNIQIYHWDKRTQGIVLSSFFWGYMIMQIPAGALAKRYGGKPLLEAALLISGMVSLVTPLLAHYGGWYLVCAFRVIMGLSQACTFSASHTLLGKWLPANERTTYIGLVYGGSSIGTIFAMPISGVLSETALGWKMIFYSMAVLCIAVAAMWHFLAASSPGEHHMITKNERRYIERGMNISADSSKVHRTPWKGIMTSRGMWAIMVAHIGSTIVFILIFVDLPTYLKKGLQISLKDSASLSALPYFGMWAGGVISTWLSQMILNKQLLSVTVVRKLFNTLSFAGAALGLIALSFLGPSMAYWAVVALVGVMFFQGFSSAGFMANYLDISPNFGGIMLSITNFVSNVGSILTPIITSFILRNDPTDVSRWRVVFLVFASASLAASAVYAVIGTSATARWDDPDYCEPEHDNVPVSEKEKEANKITV